MKRTYSIIGLIGGLIVILLGFLVLTGAFGGDTDTASSAPYAYDSGYAKFGADFYNYVANNAEEAASASRTAARNLNEIAKLLKGFCGIQLMAFGLFMTCLFGGKLKKAEPEQAAPETTAESTTAPEPETEPVEATEQEAAPAEQETSPKEPEA